LSRKTRDLEAAHNADFLFLGIAVLIQCQSVTDRGTDRRTEGRTDGQTDIRPGHG